MKNMSMKTLETIIDDGNIVVKLTKLPGTTRGYTSPSFDGTYNVYINKNLPAEMLEEVLRHEIEHIQNNDFFSVESVAELEVD